MPGTGLSFGLRAGIAVAVLIAGYLLFEFGRLQADYNIVDAIAEKQELADVITFLCSDKASYVTGQSIAVDGGFDATGIGLPALRKG